MGVTIAEEANTAEQGKDANAPPKAQESQQPGQDSAAAEEKKETPVPGEDDQATTKIDALYEYIKKHGKSDITTVASSIGVAPNIIEGWAKVLENGRLVKISYAVGKMYVELEKRSAEEEETMQKKVEMQLESEDSLLSSQAIELDKFNKDLTAIREDAKKATEVYSKVLPDVHKIFDEIDKAYKSIEHEKNEMENTRKSSERVYTEISARIDETLAKISYFSSDEFNVRSAGINDAIAKTIKGAQDIEKTLVEIHKGKDVELEAINKEITQRANEIKRQIKEANDVMSKDLSAYRAGLEKTYKDIEKDAKSARETLKEVENFKKHKDMVLKELNDAKSNFKDRYEKLNKEFDVEGAVFNKKYDEINSKMASIREGFGKAAEIDSRIRSVEGSVSDIEKEIRKAKSEIMKLHEQVTVLQRMKNMPIEKKTEAVAALGEKRQNSRKKLIDIFEKVSDAKKKLQFDGKEGSGTEKNGDKQA